MPTGGLPTDPNDFLTQLMQDPSTGPTSTPELDSYAARGGHEAELEYMTTGKMPTEMRNYPIGPIQAIGQSLGLSSKYVPLTEDVKNRAIQGLAEHKQQDVARTVSEISALNPGAMYFGSDYLKGLLKGIDPKLAQFVPGGDAGKGQAALTALDIKSRQGDEANKIRNEIAQSQIQNAQTRADVAGLTAQASEERAGAAQTEAATREEGEAAREYNFSNAPIEKYYKDTFDTLTHREEVLQNTLQKAMGSVLTTPTPAQQKYFDGLQKQIDEVQKQLTDIGGEYRRHSLQRLANSPGAKKGRPAPTASPTVAPMTDLGPTSITPTSPTSAPVATSIPPGLFR